jgi:hypothetical protein
LSLFYNLFLPPLVSVAYLFLLPALVLTPLSKALGFVFVKIADYLTQAALFITHHPPILLDFQLRFSEPSLEWTIIIITLCLALFYKSRPRFDRIRGR